jgi:hypothetical protein
MQMNRDRSGSSDMTSNISAQLKVENPFLLRTTSNFDLLPSFAIVFSLQGNAYRPQSLDKSRLKNQKFGDAKYRRSDHCTQKECPENGGKDGHRSVPLPFGGALRSR